MFRITLEQLRSSLPRLIAASLAIVIGTAFVTLTLLAGNVMNKAADNAAAARIGQADLFVRPANEGQFTAANLQAITDVPGVRTAQGVLWAFQTITGGGQTLFQHALPTPSDSQLTPFELASGRWPTQAGEVAIGTTWARRLAADLGGEVVAARELPDGGEVNETLRVVGLFDDPLGAYHDSGGAFVVPREELLRWNAASGWWSTDYDGALLALDGPVTPQLRAAIADAGTTSDGPAITMTQAEYAAQASGGSAIVYTTFGMVFASIALLVSSLVIANTFQVLVAQRVRNLALLRCVGAGKRQIRNSVLGEALGVGLAASAAGSMLGVVLARIGLFFAARAPFATPLPRELPLSSGAILTPVIIGALVTVAASLVPAMAATRVAPVAALRPLDAPTVAQRAGKRRAKATAAMLIVGALFLLWGVFTGQAGMENVKDGALLVIIGAALSFGGVLLSAVFWLPRLAGQAGRLVGVTGPTARLAVANMTRNPGRTTATATALLIGTTLVAAMTTGAATARATLAPLLASHPSIEQIISIALAITMAMLAASVLIALIGVANTLSLSVLERQRESATLRVIGLSADKLRQMLAIEGMLIAGVGAMLGVGIGLVYGWVGSAALLGSAPSPLVFRVPTVSILLAIIVALGAGYGASILPAKAAAKASPVAALAAA